MSTHSHYFETIFRLALDLLFVSCSKGMLLELDQGQTGDAARQINKLGLHILIDAQGKGAAQKRCDERQDAFKGKMPEDLCGKYSSWVQECGEICST